MNFGSNLNIYFGLISSPTPVVNIKLISVNKSCGINVDVVAGLWDSYYLYIMIKINYINYLNTRLSLTR